MSAFMVNNRTLTKIAKYMEACANYEIGKAPGLSEIALDGDFQRLLSEEGLVDKKTGLFSAPLIHAFLYCRNRHALMQRYGEKETEDKMCPSELEPMEDGGTAIDISRETRKEWLANLYTVCRCYLYQIAEGDYQDDEFYWKMSGWIGAMAKVLAAYVVAEVRPYRLMGSGERSKPWDEF